MKPNEKQRLAIYKRMLYILENGYVKYRSHRCPFKDDEAIGFCTLLSYAELEERLFISGISWLPELLEYRPAQYKDGPYWFNKFDRERRRKILVEIIEELEKKTIPFYKKILNLFKH